MSCRRECEGWAGSRQESWFGPFLAFGIALSTTCVSGGTVAYGLLLAIGNSGNPLPLAVIAPGALAVGCLVLGAMRSSMLWISLAAAAPLALLSLPLLVGGSPREQAFVASVMVGYLLSAVAGFGLGRFGAWFVERLAAVGEREE